MEDLYFFNGDTKDPYTWNQLLYLCYKMINGESRLWNRKLGKYEYDYWSDKGSSQRLEEFFSSFSHNPNDGIYREGYWKQNSHWEHIQQKDENGRPTSEWVRTLFFDDWEWIPGTFTPKIYQVTDSYNRIIPSSLIRQAYLKYIPNADHKKYKPYRSKKWSRWNHRHTWEFRKGPVPCIRKYRKGHWHKYQGNHGYLKNEVRATCGFIADMKDIEKEYDICIKLRRKRYSHTWFSLTDWDYPHYSGYKGWKRSRNKLKQWM